MCFWPDGKNIQWKNFQEMGTSGICDDDSDKRYRIIKEVKDITYTNV